MSSKYFLEQLARTIDTLNPYEIYGAVSAIQGLVIKVALKNKVVSIGSLCSIETQPQGHTNKSAHIPAEVVGFDEHHVLIMPYATLSGVHAGSRVIFHQTRHTIHPTLQWQGRIINALGQPIDDLGPLPVGPHPYPVQGTPLLSSKRDRLSQRLDVGIRAVNTFLTCCKGQRMGIFAGSGVGKSMLLSMFARHTQCDICIIGLVGERGREVNEFIAETLGPQDLQKSIVVVATSDESALMRRQAAHMTLALAEYYRDLGLSVLCLMDSVTRFAMAQREIGLSAGEPPTTKGYTPSVFAMLPQLLERAGPGLDPQHLKPLQKSGSITGLFTVLVDGDDMNEPISDAVRGILDGHIILERSIAERGRYPAINILKSVSRTVPGCHKEEERPLVKKARTLMSSYEDMADMIRLGAYKPGSSQEVDEAIAVMPRLQTYLSQTGDEVTTIEDAFKALSIALNS